MKPLFFSIIIASRDVDPYLVHEGFDAIGSLTYKNFEVLLIVDKLTKETTDIQKKYTWLKVFDLHNKPGDKRDHAAKRAKGDILAFIDADVAPRKDWLTKAQQVFREHKEIVGLGGPGVLPKKVNKWERIFDEVLQSWLGGGGYTYRFVPKSERYVDDYPSMNLLIKRNIFLKIGGFQNMYWPGEDSKLTNNLVHKNNYLILYHPDVVVYHHRRDTIAGHLDQYKNYGKTRGAFFIQGDTNSLRFQYIIPGLFFLYAILYFFSALLYILKPYNQLHFAAISFPMSLYLLLLVIASIQSYFKTKHIVTTIGIFFILPLTHAVYGFNFIKATIIEIFRKPQEPAIVKKK